MAEHQYYGNSELLDSLSVDYSLSPEDFLLFLENALETGELSISEVSQLISDYNSRQR